MRVNIIGAGNVATHLSKHLVRNNVKVVSIFSRTEASARELSEMIDSNWTTNMDSLTDHVDLNILCVPDNVIENVGKRLPRQIPVVHTSGGMPISVFEGFVKYGIIYPLQTFSKNTHLDVSNIPFFIEGNNDEFEHFLYSFSRKNLSAQVYYSDSDTRKYIHLSAVITNNFLTYFMGVAEEILRSKDMPLEILQNLLEETIKKTIATGAGKALTGPAIRGDYKTLNTYNEMIEDKAFKALFVSVNNLISEKKFSVL